MHPEIPSPAGEAALLVRGVRVWPQISSKPLVFLWDLGMYCFLNLCFPTYKSMVQNRFVMSIERDHISKQMVEDI